MSTEFINDQWRLPNAWNGSESNVNKQSNYSMDFSGTGDKIQTTLTPPLADNSRSISLWFYTSNSSTHNMCGYGAASQVSGHNGFDILTYTGNYVGIHLFGTAIIAGGTYNLNAWNHYVITYDGTTLQGYLNGVAVDSNNTEVVNTLSTNNFIIGEGVYTGFNGFSGKLDGVSIYNYALSSSQVTTLYGSSSTGIGNPMSLSPKPVAYYPLGDQDAFNGSNYLVPNSSLKDYVFDFSSDVIDTNSLGISGANARTISCWFNADNTSNQNIIGFGAVSSGNNFTIAINNNNIFAHTWNTDGVGGDLSGSAVTASKWHLAVMTYDGSNLKISLDGGTYATTLASLNTTNSVFKIGSSYYATWNNFSGKISNTKVWNTDLSQAEVETLYNNGSPIRTLANIPQNSNLQGWWKLDASATYDSSTTTWTIPDDSSNSNDGTSSGMTQANLVQSDLSFTSGYSPYALDFDSASSDYIDCGTSLGNSLGTVTSCAVSLWFKAPSTSINDFLFYIGDLSNNYGALLIQIVSNKLRVRLNDNAGNFYLDFTSNDWNNVVFVYDGSNQNNSLIYINGQLQTAQFSSLFPSSLNLSGLKTIIGTGYSTAYSFDGQISNASFWNTDLTSAQVTEIYNEGVPSNLNNHSAYSNLVSWWQLGSNSSFNTNWTVLDEKGSNNGTSSNMTEASIVDGVGSYANGLSSGMGGDEVIGDAPYSSSNSLSVNMDVLDRVTDTPS